MLRKIRIFAATFCFVLITLLFLDFTGTIHAWFGWLAKIQFWPALLALNVGVVVVDNLDSFIGACILLRYLPFRGIARYHFVVC